MKEENRLRKRQEIVFDACYGNIHADRLVEIKVMFLNVPEEKRSLVEEKISGFSDQIEELISSEEFQTGLYDNPQ